MRELPLEVLAHEGPQARIYLALLARHGLRPRGITLLVLSRHPRTGGPVGRWMPRLLRMPFARSIQDQSLNYWARRIRREHPELVAAVARGLRARVGLDPLDLYEEVYGSFRYEACGPVTPLLVEGLGDPALADALAARGPVTWLYTGGGLLPAACLRAGGRFVHVHPGYLPHVRGADGLLWSVLVRGRPAVSCFYMDEGLDTGALIASEELARLRIPLREDRRPPDEVLYRAVFAFCDPLLRARFLIDVLPRERDGVFPSRPQEAEAGITYHFLHPRLRGRALRRLFPAERV